MMLGLLIAPNELCEMGPRPARPRRLDEYTIPLPLMLPVRKDIFDNDD